MAKITKTQKAAGAVLLLALIVLVGLLTWNFTNRADRYATYNTATTMKQVNAQAADYANKEALEYDIVYKTGCKDCKKVAPFLVPAIAKMVKQGDNNLIVLDAMDDNLHNYFNRIMVTHTPTVTVKYRGFIIYQYAGTNKHQLTRLMAGYNPKTGKKLKQEIPDKSYIVNDFTHTDVIQPAFDTSMH